ncbi:MAG: ribosomal protein S18-alanine N-acetyltransferase [Halobacteria archaeon]|nr:ribosomal protein S18-alanine N-acetyltransferase [Halobacteria archaeon]
METQSEIRIRTAQGSDIHGVLRVEKECFDEWSPHLLIQLCGRTETLLVCEDESEGDITGYALGILTNSTHARVMSLGVRKEYRRQGIGRALMEELLDVFRNKDISNVELEVRVSNTAAQELYESLGFTKERRRDSYYSDGEDAYVMQKQL